MAERAESSVGTKEARNALMYLLWRWVLLSVFDPQKGVSLSPYGVGFSPFLFLVYLFTGVVAPTICS